MKTTQRPRPLRPAPSRELARLRARLREASETLRAIRSGEVDAVMGAGRQGDQVFTLEGAGHAYRNLIESMNEGALTLTADKTILYANQSFARMVKCPLEQVTGSSFRRFLSATDRTTLRSLMKRAARSGAKIQVQLHARDGTQMPVQISLRLLARNRLNHVTIGMVVTDMTEARRAEELLRALSNHVVQAQEAERGGVALELHDHITQLLCAVVFRSQALADKISARNGPLKREAMNLGAMLGATAEEVERISRNLRPSVLDELGLDAVLRVTSTEFAQRTGLSVGLACVQSNSRLPADTELALYRILQETLKNVETHAHAHHVTVELSLPRGAVRLTVKDDGVGFEPDRHTFGQSGTHGVGLLGMRERAAYLGGTLRITSAPRGGTAIEVQIPVRPPAAPAAVATPKSRRSARLVRVRPILRSAVNRRP